MAKLLIICGPTATGKTKLGVELAKKYNGEILSADSRQVYKGMDITTGKDLKEYNGVPVWGLDLANPDYSFNVSDYVNYALPVLEDIVSRGKLPIIVGGTGQYIKELLNPSETLHIPPNEKLRERLLHCSIASLQEELKKCDLKKWERMNSSDRLNPRRLTRAIEVSSFKNLNIKNFKLISNFKFQISNCLMVGLTAPYDFLYSRIDARVEDRVKAGMEDEIKKLLAMGYSKDLPSMSGLGYREFPDLEKWKFTEHNYARRQMTFFKNQFPKIEWFDITQLDYPDNVESKVSQWYNLRNEN